MTTRHRLGELFDAHHRGLYALARRLCGDADEARDLVQETFLRAARRAGDLPAGDRAARAWLTRVLVNLCRDRWRRLGVRRRARAEAVAAAGGKSQRDEGPEAAALARIAVQAALGRLPPRRRAIVVLHAFEGLDAGEIAELLGIGRVTVRWHLSVARRQLRRLLMERD